MRASCAWLIFVALPAAGADGPTIFEAIRSGDTGKIKAYAANPQELEARDRRGVTPLMYAAAFGSVSAMKLLLDAGADPKARNEMGASALLWAAGDPEKARLLIESGADAMAVSKQGRTPLMVAASRNGGVVTVELLLSKGVDVRAKDRLGNTALTLAAKAGDLDTVKLLLAKGADPNATDVLGRGPLFRAAGVRNPALVWLLIQRRAAVNAATSLPSDAAVRTANNIKNGPPSNSIVTPLHIAAAFGPVESVRELLKAGADVNAQDSRKLGPLSFALATEYPSLEIVRALIGAGAEVNVADNHGDTPLDWAEKFGYPEVIAELKKAGSRPGRKYEAPHLPERAAVQPAVALERTIKLLESSGPTFFKGSGCVSCHHQNLIVRAQSRAKAAGLSTNEAVQREQTLQMKSEWLPLQEGFLQGMLPGGEAARLAENLLGLEAVDYAPDAVTDSAAVAMAAAQRTDGSWTSGEVQHRPPLGESSFSATAKVVRALRHYAIPARKQQLEAAIELARLWLTQTKPVTTEDHAMRLCGLFYAGASRQDVTQAAAALLALQRTDGGWGGNPYMKSDAYATGVALTSLGECAALTAGNDGAFQRGIAYLLSTQFPDGSWYVRSRSIKFQPYFESGFPFGHDQWISAAATSWAAQAIALSLEPAGKPPLWGDKRR